MNGAFLFAGLLAAAPAAADPGNENILRQGTPAARVYLVEIHRDSAGVVNGLGLAWLPADIEAGCLGKDFSSCRALDQGRLARRKPGGVPSHLLVELITDAARLKTFCVRWGVKPDGGLGVEMTRSVSRAKSVRARLRWEVWTNGENFRLLKLLD